MGLAKSPGTFQIVVDVVLCGLSSKSCLVYPDDIIVFSRTSDEHLVHLQDFERLATADLRLIEFV